MSENEISWEHVKTLYAYDNAKGAGYEIRVGSWIVNGRKGEPVLEKREWWTNNQGNRMQGKQKSLNKADLYRIFDAAAELSTLLGFPLPKAFAGALTPKESLPPKNEAQNHPVSTPAARF